MFVPPSSTIPAMNACIRSFASGVARAAWNTVTSEP